MLLLSLGCLPQVAQANRDLQNAASLIITSDPPGAQVQINRQVRGTTPLELTNLAPGVHFVQLSLRDHDDYMASVRLEAGMRHPLDLRLEPYRAAVLIHSQPEGANVSLDGAHRGMTPLLLPAVDLGRHRVTVSRPGYQERIVELDVAGQTPQKIEVQLLTDSATLRVETEPAGATIMLNGVPRGAAPVVIERIPDGDSEIEIRAEGYAVFKQDIRLAAGDDERLAVTLTPLPGTLKVVSIPEGARVYLNNQLRGETPFTMAEMTPGEYRVRVELTAYDPMARTVTIGRAADVVEEFRLVANCGELRVVTAPAGVSVIIDGKLRGETVARSGASDQISEPLTIPLVAAGQREVAFSRPGYFEQRTTIEIERDEIATLDATLKRRFIPDYEVRTASNVYRGVLINITPEVIRLETEIGVIRAFQVKDIKGRRPLRDDERAEIVAPPEGANAGGEDAEAVEE